MSNIKKIRNQTLDILKFVAAFSVICIHFMFDGKTGEIMSALSRFAVPVFFMSSGYFSLNNSSEKLKRKIVRILSLYMCGILLYGSYYAMVRFFEYGIKGVLWYGVSYLRPKTIINFLLFNATKSSDHLWFLPALIYCYFIFLFLNKKNLKDKYLIISAVVLLLINIILDECLSFMGVFIPNIFVRNFLLLGYPFFLTGMLLRKYKDKILIKINNSVLNLMLFAGIFETVISALISRENEIYLGTVFVSLSLFIYALKFKKIKYNKKMDRISDVGTIIYIIHVFIGNLVLLTPIKDTMLWKYFSPVLVGILSFIIAYIINILSCKLKIKNIKIISKENNYENS